MKLYKLTDQNGKSLNNTQWGAGITHTADGKSNVLCNEHWIHAYTDPLLGIFMNPAHSAYRTPRLWECEGTVGLRNADKCGCTSLTTVKEIEMPTITLEMRRKFARLCAIEVYPAWKEYDIDGKWLAWENSLRSEIPNTILAAAEEARALVKAAEEAAATERNLDALEAARVAEELSTTAMSWTAQTPPKIEMIQAAWVASRAAYILTAERMIELAHQAVCV